MVNIDKEAGTVIENPPPPKPPDPPTTLASFWAASTSGVRTHNQACRHMHHTRPNNPPMRRR